MKVLQVLPSLSAGGAEGFVTNLGVSLTELGTEVRFFIMVSMRDERGQVLLKRLREVGIEVVGVDMKNIRSPMNIVRLAAMIRSWQPDIVQANMYQTEVLLTIARILTIDSGACYVRRLANTELVGYRSSGIVRLMDRFFRQTIACSPAVAVTYREFMKGKHKSELVTIPNGGLLQEAITTNEEKRRAREKLALPAHAFVVAHIGRMFPGSKTFDGGIETGQKAHDVLIRAFAKAFGGKTDCVLVLVGDGPLRPEVEALAMNLGISAQTRFLELQPEPWTALKAANVFFFPSRYEGLPNVLPEAASCGLPVLASDIPEIRSLSPGDAWLLKPVNDVDAFAEGLREVAAQHAIYRQRAELVAPQIRERLSMKACAEKYLNFYISCKKAKK